MTFGNNSLVLTYDPTGFGSGTNSHGVAAAGGSAVQSPAGDSGDSATVTLAFNALEALAGVATGEGWEERVGGGVKVSMAEQWGKNRCAGYRSQLEGVAERQVGAVGIAERYAVT